ncbi:MAG: hypothetical protein FK734_10665 [Asgard group archaeon]|nr:hypothetical protein [Asgard group archaeon]
MAIIVRTETEVSASTPSTGKISLFVDSSTNVLKTKDVSGSIKKIGGGNCQNLSPTSGSEIDTGYTFEGKVVYRQFFSGSSLPLGTTILINDVDDFVRGYGFVINDDGSKWSFPVDESSSLYARFNVDTSNRLNFSTAGAAITGNGYKVVAEYTKI